MTATQQALRYERLCAGLMALFVTFVPLTNTVGDLASVILSVYAFKVAIAALDTPLCYLGVRTVERITGVDARTVR